MPNHKIAPSPYPGCRIVTLTTDFGTQDWFVGVMKGVMLEREPTLRLIDITHAIPAGDIRSGAFCLMNAWNHCPEGTVHLAVVDPGVGGARRAIALQARGRFYVGPDNGLASWAVRQCRGARVHEITNLKLCRQPVSTTFHGRDIFAPVAAFLAGGGSMDSLGPASKLWVRLRWPSVRKATRGSLGEVLHIDRFGNAITNLPANQADLNRCRLKVEGLREELPLVRCYGDIPPGRAAAIAASTGLLEVAVNQGCASTDLGIRVGDRVRLWMV